MKIWNDETKKYLIRFGLLVAIMAPVLIWAQGFQAVKIITYKTCLVAGGIGFAEMIWAVWFKRGLGPMEKSNASQRVYVFRGILYAAIILAFTLGL